MKAFKKLPRLTDYKLFYFELSGVKRLVNNWDTG